MDLKRGIWLSQLQKLDPFMDSGVLFYVILLWSSKAQKLLQELCCSICGFLEGKRTAPFSMVRLELCQWKEDFLPVINRKTQRRKVSLGFWQHLLFCMADNYL